MTVPEYRLAGSSLHEPRTIWRTRPAGKDDREGYRTCSDEPQTLKSDEVLVSFSAVFLETQVLSNYC
jgi:hypothetical protein